MMGKFLCFASWLVIANSLLADVQPLKVLAARKFLETSARDVDFNNKLAALNRELQFHIFREMTGGQLKTLWSVLNDTKEEDFLALKDSFLSYLATQSAQFLINEQNQPIIEVKRLEIALNEFKGKSFHKVIINFSPYTDLFDGKNMEVLKEVNRLSIRELFLISPTLETLKLIFEPSKNHILHLSTLHVRSGEDDNFFGDEGVEFLADCQCLNSLENLFLINQQLTGRSAFSIAKSMYLTNLRLLHLDELDGGVIPVGGDYNIREGMQALVNSKNMNHLIDLSLCGHNIGDAEIEFLVNSKTITKLKRLGLAANRIKDSGIELLANSNIIEELTHLDISENPITVKGIKELASSKHIMNLKFLKLTLRKQDEGVLSLFNKEIIIENTIKFEEEGR